MIELRNVSKTYRIGTVSVRALRNVSVRIEPGEFVAIMGPSGSGKSTLLHILGFLDRPDSGEYRLNGEPVAALSGDDLAGLRSRTAGFVFQQFHLLPRKTAWENVKLPLRYGGNAGREDEWVLERIRAVGLEKRMWHKPNELSGGEQQRVAIARSLVNDPPLIMADEPTGNLDSKTEEEILAILKGLHEQGKTVIMVTHEKNLAERSGRIISMRDGEIVSDVKTETPRVGSSGAAAGPARPADGKGGLPGWLAGLGNNLREAGQAVLGNKLRSFLSVLGILIGVASVIAMLALGGGAKESLSQTFAQLGTNLLSIHSGARFRGGVAMQAGSVTRLTIKDAEAVADLPEIRRVSPSVQSRVQLVYGNKNWNSQVEGVGLEYADMRASQPTSGRFFSREEMARRAKVALLGRTVVRELFGQKDPVGETVKVNRANFTVIGVLPVKGTRGPRDQDDTVVCPITTAMYRVLGKDYVDGIDAEVKDVALMEQAKESIRNLLRSRHRTGVNQEDPFHIMDLAEIQAAFKGMTETMTTLLGAIAAISLLVGGIGIMNIMLVSVTERTREIGLRKALGARSQDIMQQFLVEAMVLTGVGGLLGVTVGASAAFFMGSVADWAMSVSPSSVLLAVLFSVVVGVAFGLWPARKGSQLDPIRALRYE